MRVTDLGLAATTHVSFLSRPGMVELSRAMQGETFMSDQLSQAIAALHLQPGEVFRTTVSGNDVEVRMLAANRNGSGNGVERSEFDDMVMLEPWFSIPEGIPIALIKPVLQAQTLPDPPIIPAEYEGLE